ncbi:formate/nitrite transporter family protein [Ammoniphilus sp. 3BR4]|uniref:formate/nitrite transporter family protein n=1 Tax=Ammoniphilus sp. 3BR4 TaxID=3158265 RepID=UPI003466637B
MYKETFETIGNLAEEKKKMILQHPFRYLLSSSLAGAYVGFGIVLIFILGGQFSAANSPFTTLIMGISFAVALILVVFSGSELFTGNHMIYTISTLSGKTTIKDTLINWAWCYAGNALGAAVFCLLIIGSGVFSNLPMDHLLYESANKKMHLSTSELFFRGILCNWLVCLAIWMGIKTKSESAKIMLIFWCLFAFVSSGYEHSIANMTVLSLALLLPHPETISWAGLVHNLVPVTLGNIVGGGLFVGAAYWSVGQPKTNRVFKESKGKKLA